MAFNPDKLLFKEAISGTMFSPTTGLKFWSLEDLKDVQLSCSADSEDKTDASGAVIAKFYNAKTGQITGNTSYFTLSLMAAQFGSDKKVATSLNKLIAPKREKITLTTAMITAGKITLEHVPLGTAGSEIPYIYLIDDDKIEQVTYSVGVSASATTFVINAANKEITLPTDSTNIKAGNTILVYYTFESEKAVEVDNNAHDMPRSGEFWLEAIFSDICDQNLEYHGWVVMNSAQLSPETNIPLDKTGDFPFTIDTLSSYCSEDGQLFRFIIPDENVSA